MANGQQKAQQNVEAFISWSSTMADDDYRQIVHRGKLNRNEIAKGVGCAKSALLQNPKLRGLLEALEIDLMEREVLPELTESAAKLTKAPQKYDQTASKRQQDAKRITELELEVLRLKMQLERFKELSEVILELGLDS
jgi:hypothetical protein